MKFKMIFFLSISYCLHLYSEPLKKYQRLLPKTHTIEPCLKIINQIKTDKNYTIKHTRLSFSPKKNISSCNHLILHTWKEDENEYVMEQAKNGMIHLFITEIITSTLPLTKK